MSQIIITHNSHSLSNLQRCPQRYLLSDLDSLRTKERNRAMSRGTIVHEYLKWFYLGLKKGLDARKAALLAYKWMGRRKDIDLEEKITIQSRFLEYANHYNHGHWRVKGLEVGFSRILYQTQNVLFIYEGKIDLIVELVNNANLRAWVDTKTQGKKYDYYKQENQFIGYTWALNARHGILNYIGMQANKNENTFRQDLWSYTPDDIKEWREQTIKWYYRTLDLKLRKDYPKAREGCRNQYGVCEYSTICDANHPYLVNQIRERDYVVEPYRSW